MQTIYFNVLFFEIEKNIHNLIKIMQVLGISKNMLIVNTKFKIFQRLELNYFIYLICIT